MTAQHRLGQLLMDAAHGVFPAADGSVEVVPSPPGRSDAVIAFSAHSVIAAGLERDEALARWIPRTSGRP